MDFIDTLVNLNEYSIFIWLTAGGMTGSFCKFIVSNYDFDKSPYELERFRPKSWDVVFAHILARIILGAVAGGLVGLVLVDAMKMEYGAALRMIFLSFVAGYSAPELLKTQERKMLSILDKHLSKNIKNEASEAG